MQELVEISASESRGQVVGLLLALIDVRELGFLENYSAIMDIVHEVGLLSTKCVHVSFLLLPCITILRPDYGSQPSTLINVVLQKILTLRTNT